MEYGGRAGRSRYDQSVDTVAERRIKAVCPLAVAAELLELLAQYSGRWPGRDRGRPDPKRPSAISLAKHGCWARQNTEESATWNKPWYHPMYARHGLSKLHSSRKRNSRCIKSGIQRRKPCREDLRSVYQNQWSGVLEGCRVPAMR